MPTFTKTTTSPTETRALAAQLGASLRGGEVIALLGDLGAGKTTFAQGILEGMGSRDRVTSPTFTLVNLYRAGRLEVHHVDAYRLATAADATISADQLTSLGLDDLLGDRDVVLLIEWANIAPTLLKQATLTIALDTPQVDDLDQRTITFSAENPAALAFLTAIPTK